MTDLEWMAGYSWGLALLKAEPALSREELDGLVEVCAARADHPWAQGLAVALWKAIDGAGSGRGCAR
jgi:hypothetical protein